MKRLLLVTAAVLLAGGCGFWQEDRGIGDAAVGEQNFDPAFIIVMPDKFANVAFKCHKKDGIYVTTRDAAPVVVPNDPNCVVGG